MALCGLALGMTVLVVKLGLEAGGEGTLGGQVILQPRDVISQARDIILQAQDAQGRSQAVALVDQLSEAAGEGQLAAGIASVRPGERSLTSPHSPVNDPVLSCSNADMRSHPDGYSDHKM